MDLSTPLQLIGRSAEFQHIVEVLARDGDLLITGVPGSGRRTLVRGAAQEVGAIALEIDCICAIDGQRFVQLLAEAISQNWQPEKIQGWVAQNGSEFFVWNLEGKLKLLLSLNSYLAPLRTNPVNIKRWAIKLPYFYKLLWLHQGF